MEAPNNNNLKSFDIGLRDGLLDPKHVEAMGVAVWLYAWIIRRVTKVSDGYGLVLGGVPVKSELIQEQLGIDRGKYGRWLHQLEQHGYIETTRTPRGLVIRVTKGKKTFGKSDVSKVVHHSESDAPKMIHQTTPVTPLLNSDVSKMNSDVSKMLHANKENTIESNNNTAVFETIKNIIQPKARYSDAYGKLIKKALKSLTASELEQAARHFAWKFNGGSDWHSNNKQYFTLNQFFGGDKNHIPRYETCLTEANEKTTTAPAQMTDDQLQRLREQQQADLAARNARIAARGVTA